MRRTARVLSAAFLTATVTGTLGPAAYAESTAQADPQTVTPGDTVTVSVSCDPADGPAPETIDADSQAFEQGTVKLRRLPGNDDSAGGPSYQGTAHIAPAVDFETGADTTGTSTEWGVNGVCPAPPGGEQRQWSAPFTVQATGDAHPPAYQPQDDHSTYQPQGQPKEEPKEESLGQLDHQSPGQPKEESPGQPKDKPKDKPKEEPKEESPGQLDYQSPGQPKDKPKEESPGRPEHHATHQPDDQATHTPAPVQHGVHAGGGGAFTDSVPAMVAGGLLIVGALGAAVYRLRSRNQ